MLEIGFSWGETTSELQSIYPASNIIAVDVDFKSISEGPPLNDRACFLVADGYNPPYLPEIFDTVFCMSDLYYEFKAKKAQAEQYLKSVDTQVKDSGYLLISGRAIDAVIFIRQGDVFVPTYYNPQLSDFSNLTVSDITPNMSLSDYSIQFISTSNLFDVNNVGV
ncbi:hypothetical protein SAMN05660420_01455 [Desulfuromusa kysingii]|uniref:Methyltransferase type 11 domain-containing protein n=1 Tax=Desulfuromusa kysingii TaxID=37625 RepID=A0A1H3YZE7_9BACT|nr:class I SAM-dependent methyltransferase [Desulfuromusa kysingii]SEA16797.1 hypothetical protein SAMN05660420_01455 [Desulfuromusa kysingii]